ncbi:cilia- and flagella-associated protein 53-like [Lethenteron reissneri]|uniref:cilia- and flagella-associated protein 53-like n=1 Tax=Lethenteron reissneri TaxID=7753 RepID=UPI002AB7C228|nr:cilia- and flagella-associated protein 53-like [Lethenteron reissneri]
MMSLERTRRRREVTGPGVHTVALRERGSRVMPALSAQASGRWRQQAREDALALVQADKLARVKGEWEQRSEQRATRSAVDRHLYTAMQGLSLSLQDRRERLTKLLEEEESGYLEELQRTQETTLERQARMRERAKALREQRECERQQLVTQKLDQQFREQSEELRTVLSRWHQDQVCTERHVQLAERDAARQREHQEERLFAELWERDRLAKTEREERQALERAESNRESLQALQQQRAAVQEQREQAKRLKQEEAELMREQRELCKVEEERAQQDKQRQRQQTRAMLDSSVRFKLQRLARERQEEMDLDMRLLEQMVQTSSNESQDQQQRKMELRKEQQLYRQHLAQQAEEERQCAREMERLMGAELERMWRRREEQWRLEKEARNRLFKDVMDARKQQIQEKLDCNSHKQQELIQDQKLMEEAAKESKRIEEEQQARVKSANWEHQAALRSQIEHQQRVHAAERQAAQQEHEQTLLAQAAYQEKLHYILSRPESGSKLVHPLRRVQSPFTPHGGGSA